MVEIRIKIANFSFISLKQNFSFSIWILINQIGVLLFLQSELLLINYFFGVYYAGLYSVVILLITQVRNISNLFSGVFAPMVIKGVLEHNEGINNSIRKVVTLNTMFVSVFCTIITVTSHTLLPLWVGNEYMKVDKLLDISMISLAINLSLTPYWNVLLAHKKVQSPAIITIILGIISVASSWVLIRYFNLSIVGMILLANIVLLIKNLIFIPIVLQRSCSVRINQLYCDFFINMTILFIYYVVNKFINGAVSTFDLFGYICQCGFMFIVDMIISLFFLKVIYYKGVILLPALKSDLQTMCLK